jgi:hypothetical protein
MIKKTLYDTKDLDPTNSIEIGTLYMGERCTIIRVELEVK